MTLEQDIQREIVSWLDTQKAIGRLDHWRVTIGVALVGKGIRRKNPLKGHPDLAGVLRPGARYFTIEVKRPGSLAGRWYPEQLEWGTRLREDGVLYIVATSVEDVKRAIEEHHPLTKPKEGETA